MKLRNSTDFADHFLRRMVAWCYRELQLPVKRLTECAFRNSRDVWGGLAYWRSRIGVRVGTPAACDRELKHWKFNDGFQIVTHDRIEVLLVTTAHELAHIEEFWRMPPRPCGLLTTQEDVRAWKEKRRQFRRKLERRTEGRANVVLAAFRQQREQLLADWNRPAAERPKVDPVDRRAEKVARDLARWQRKAKRAATKIRKLRQRVRYYERRQAAKRSQSKL